MYIPIQTLRSHFLLKLFLVRFSFFVSWPRLGIVQHGCRARLYGTRSRSAREPRIRPDVSRQLPLQSELRVARDNWPGRLGVLGAFEFFSKQGGPAANITPIQDIAWHHKGHVIYRQHWHFQCNACHTCFRAS